MSASGNMTVPSGCDTLKNLVCAASHPFSFFSTVQVDLTGGSGDSFATFDKMGLRQATHK
jgi:hypothetical protein